MNELEDITERYAQFVRVDLSKLAVGSDLVIGDLIRTPDGRILVPDIGPEEANLFAIYSKVDGEQVLVAELPTLGEAEEFLDPGEAKGYEPLRCGDFLSAERWEDNPALKEALYPWIRSKLLTEKM